jgi:hypothetical protein
MSRNPLRSSAQARLVATAVTVLSLVVVGAPAQAAADHSVDPATLTPVPPAFFNAQCRTAGQQILCDLAFLDPVSPVLEPTDLTCGEGAEQFVLLDSWTRTVRGTRYYTSDGLLTRRHFNDRFEGTLTNSVTGASVSYDSHSTYLHDLAVPGDNSTGTERDTLHTPVDTGPGAPVLEARRSVYSPPDDTILFRSGQHRIDDWLSGDTIALDKLCAALS